MTFGVLVGLGRRLEIHDFHGIALALNEVDFPGQDVLVPDKGHVHFRPANVVPAPLLTIHIAQHMPKSDLPDLRGQVDALLVTEVGIVHVEPEADIVFSHAFRLFAQHGLVDVLDGLMHKLAKQHGAFPNGAEFPVLEKLVLPGTALINKNMRGIGVTSLDARRSDGVRFQR